MDGQMPAGAVVGQLVTETLEFEHGRDVTVYVPMGPVDAIVFSGDGQLTSQWAQALEAARARSTMIVGVHRSVDETLRLHEYSPAFAPDRFASHEEFVVQDVRRWTRSRFGVDLPTDRTAVFGASAGGELALALGHRHPDIFGAVLCASPGAGYQPPEIMPQLLPRTYLVAGTLEPFFLENALRWARAIGDSGVDVVMASRVGGHGGTFWQEEFPVMVAWAFER